ncbi:MAG TPA: aldo/keto reductase [Turneriella sp.]|nr:aldo/keto reductase [Turneriella sp.]
MRGMLSSQITLHNGQKIPQLGFGVWKAAEGECYKAVRTALEVGYRHIDTARIYGNEEDVGRAIRDSGIAREEIYVTTKLWNSDQPKAQKAFDDSLARLGLDYIDLYLVHFPVTKSRAQAWKDMEQILASGKTRSVGVSNYMQRHLDELLAASSLKPVVNQVELHPWLSQQELKQHCESRGIRIEAYSPLAHGQKVGDLSLKPMADKYGKSVAQLILRWSIQKGNIVLVKSVSPQRIAENFVIFDFEIDGSDMTKLDSLNENLRTCWDPSNTP